MTDKDIEWIDGRREPQAKPNPAYPFGIDLDMAGPADQPTCRITLPYPARRIGHFVVNCKTCGWSGIITTAGRPDDPRSVKVSCRMRIARQ